MGANGKEREGDEAQAGTRKGHEAVKRGQRNEQRDGKSVWL